eukprot:TRINITY_DN27478_c0_g1_i1.p1 TRINITY_DN27478_c0_g1~~TRINITY_DN27478_c0_g1_i1.p1  ORF type:complete len:368 (-),score=68.67 TRINITY_DN27478_c0_g1_i1:72-1175(-)
MGMPQEAGSSCSSESSAESDIDVDKLQLRTGTLGYCRFVVRGVAKTAQVRAVEVGLRQTVVAAPVECAVGASGAWADADELEHLGFTCACTEAGSTCRVVFHSVDSDEVSHEEPSSGTFFRFEACGRHLQPTTRSLLSAYHGVAQERAKRIQAEGGSSWSAEGCFEVRIAESSSLFVKNSVILIPDLLTQEECSLLKESAERQSSQVADSCSGNFLQRISVRDLEPEVQELSTLALKLRVLPFFEHHLPEVARGLFGRSSGLKEMDFKYHSLEPAVNRYRTGGEFQVHTDDFSVTVNVLLSDLEDFTGSGTAFWPSDTTCAEAGNVDPLILHPRKGTAIIFNGNVVHCGKAVESGLRHVYVASFNLS